MEENFLFGLAYEIATKILSAGANDSMIYVQSFVNDVKLWPFSYLYDAPVSADAGPEWFCKE